VLDADGRRPCFGAVDRLQTNPRWRDGVLFFEYFNGDDGTGLGASHQAGWTALVADVIRRRHGSLPSVGETISGSMHDEDQARRSGPSPDVGDVLAATVDRRRERDVALPSARCESASGRSSRDGTLMNWTSPRVNVRIGTR
jgi:hypothetical protein